MDYARARERMVQEQIEARGIVHPAVLQAMREVPRHRFVEEALAPSAYGDHALPIGYVYHSAIASDTYAALPPLEKQQALLQGVVLGDGVASSMPRITPASDIVDVPYSVMPSGSVTRQRRTNSMPRGESKGTWFIQTCLQCTPSSHVRGTH